MAYMDEAMLWYMNEAMLWHMDEAMLWYIDEAMQWHIWMKPCYGLLVSNSPSSS